MVRTLIDVGLSPKLFVNDEVIEQAVGCSRQINQAVKYSGNPVLCLSDTETQDLCQCMAVLHDQQDGLYKMWYNAILPGHDEYALFYAISADGIKWDHPDLGLYEFDGSKNNNVLADAYGKPLPYRARVFFNPATEDPKKKYISLFQSWHFYVGYSPDGIHWDIDFDHVAWERGSGDGLGESYHLMYDQLLQKWRGYVRIWIRGNAIRVGGYGESKDMTSWTGPRIQYRADDQWGLGAQIYVWCTWYDAGMYWAMPHVYLTDMHPDPRMHQTMHLGLLYSSDGEDWKAVDKSTDYIPLGQEGQFDSEGLYCLHEPVLQDQNILFYYEGCRFKHDGVSNRGDRAFGRALGRRGGYVALKANPSEEGVIMSRQFQLRGDQLFINAHTAKDGYVKAEFLNPNGQIIKAFSIEETADAFNGDAINHLVTWKGDSSLKRLLGEKVRMRFRFANAEIFGFQFGESSPGISDISAGPTPLSPRFTETPPMIDGDLADTVWEDFTSIATIDKFVLYDKLEPAPIKSTVYVTYDDRGVYMGFSLDEPHMDKLVATHKQGDDGLFSDDCMQIELQPNGPDGVATIIYFNSDAVKYQLLIDPKRAHSGTPDTNPSWEAATARAKARWTAELKIPYASLDVSAAVPGDSWKMNIHRFRHTEGRMEVYSWICVFGNFSRHDRRGDLRFV